VSIVFTATGTVGGTLASIYIDYQIKRNLKPKYDLLIKLFLTVAIGAILIKALIINYVNDKVIVALTAIIGFGLNSFLPLCLQSFIEKLYPSFELVLTTAIM
jgi:FLVCR family feline leukemia virus subgroup C receptor-related protein